MLNKWLDNIPNRKLPLLFLFVIFFPFIFIAVISAGNSLYEYNTVNDWKSVDGKIIKADLKSAANEDFEYSLDVVYNYMVNGKTYTSSRINIADDTYHWDEAKEELKSFNVGDRVTVYYNPVNPKKAVLNKDLTIQFFVVVLGALFFALGGYLILSLVFD